MELETARALAQEVVDLLKPHCVRIEVAGSIRRRKSLCHDIDIVLVPGNQGRLALALHELNLTRGGELFQSGLYRGQQVDIYIANATTWVTKLLIRTGSKEHNIELCSKAKAMGMKLHADGSGLTLGEKRMIPTTEKQVFELLELPYKRPEER